MGRKTFEIKALKEWANEQLKRTDEYALTHPDFKTGICIMIEQVLLKSGNYEGFQYLYWDEFGYEEWDKLGCPEEWPEKKLYIYGSKDSKYQGSDQARRYY